MSKLSNNKGPKPRYRPSGLRRKKSSIDRKRKTARRYNVAIHRAVRGSILRSTRRFFRAKIGRPTLLSITR